MGKRSRGFDSALNMTCCALTSLLLWPLSPWLAWGAVVLFAVAWAWLCGASMELAHLQQADAQPKEPQS